MAAVRRRPPTQSLVSALQHLEPASFPAKAPRATHQDTELLLNAFMAYLSTLFHHPPTATRPAMRRVTMPGPRVLRTAAGRRYLHAYARPSRTSSSSTISADELCNRFRTHTLTDRTSKRKFHNYFVTHLPSSSLHPDSRLQHPHHKLPRSASVPHKQDPGAAPAAVPPNIPSRDLTVVRIPLRSAKHHFGTAVSRGQRNYNEDTNQAGTISMPSFAKRAPMSLVRSQLRSLNENATANSAFGDPQIFYFAVFDGHGGSECSEFLRDELHGYIEQAALDFGLQSSLQRQGTSLDSLSNPTETFGNAPRSSRDALNRIDMKSPEEVQDRLNVPETKGNAVVEEASHEPPLDGDEPTPAVADAAKAEELEIDLLDEYRNTVGGYFRRFNSRYFSERAGARARQSGSNAASSTDENRNKLQKQTDETPATTPVTVETVLTYAFLRADLDFITAQARKPDPDDLHIADNPVNKDEVLGQPHLPPSGHRIGGPARFKGGSTASIALIATPTPAPFWHPAAHSTLLVAHVGDTRVLLCETATGLPRPLTHDHHPSSPVETRRLMRYAESLITDSFGEERIGGLANSRSFGDMQSKRIGVSAEPEIIRVNMEPAEYSFLVLMSDGVSGTLSDQEVVDVIKEARTPEEGAKNVIEYATEVSADGDNATCLVVRLGGWERRMEGGLGSLGTKEIRDARRAEALDPRRGRR
ncbi:phosphatase 2C-like domain-containing protein [Neurospora hispaniola]|uniref:Phosphatase 2C-like domain-containing protein n=1 Tax=Neurospora hispaniola TaxID=588809 RepID=A0AAJ0I522_9PEZI|nr:phosphatase 2C-like domain-containing protein [Neurospora hispaniola]